MNDHIAAKNNQNEELFVELENDRQESSKKTLDCPTYWVLILPFVLIPLIPFLYYTLDVTTPTPYNPTATGTDFYTIQ